MLNTFAAFIPAVKLNVTLEVIPLVTIKSLQKPSKLIVTVPPDELNELASNTTSSIGVGTIAGFTLPPELVAQWVRSVHTPVPPTQ